MKKLILGVALSVVSFGVMAQSTCDIVAEYAEASMTARQSGASLQDLMAVVNSGANKESNDFFMLMVIDAYAVPAYNTESYQQKAIAEFKNSNYRSCLKTFSRKK